MHAHEGRDFMQHHTHVKSECLITATKAYVILWDVARRLASNLNVFHVFVCFERLLVFVAISLSLLVSSSLKTDRAIGDTL